MATKKVGGGSKNGRDSIGRRLGIKINHLQSTSEGSIIIRQRGLKYKCGTNVYLGKDHTIHALVSGSVRFFKRGGNTFVSIIASE